MAKLDPWRKGPDEGGPAELPPDGTAAEPLDAYIYAADVWCEPCALAVRERLAAEGKRPPAWLHADSEDWPQGPYGDGGGESDSPQHCAGCGAFFGNPLTAAGERYVAETIRDDRAAGRLDSVAVTLWAREYRDYAAVAEAAGEPEGDD